MATLEDNIDANWARSDKPIVSGSPLYNNMGPLRLVNGIVKIHFDYGAIVTLEAPAEIELKTSEHMVVNYGRIYVRVPEYATGFIVDTPSSKIVDLGTEFGVKVGINGSSDIHMMKGKASLIPGRPGSKRKGTNLLAGEAKRIDNAGVIRKVELEKNLFVRDISSETGFVWRGGDIMLADIVGGGNGFGTGEADYGIDMRTGKAKRIHSTHAASPSSGHYVKAQNPYVDGVFVPDGGSGPIRISSTNLLFDQCPDTDGWFNGDVFNGAWHNHIEDQPPHTLNLEGRTFTRSGEAIYMHANLGITFDLDNIRESMPNVDIDRFTALCGVSDTVLEKWTESSRVDFWILVDGTLEFQQIDAKPEDIAFDVDIPIEDGDRFLTLVTTDSGSEFDGSSRDWALFAEPTLHINLRKDKGSNR